MKNALEDEAKAAIDDLPLNAANYDTAVDLLKERFGWPRKIIFLHIQDLLNLRVPSRSSLRDLWAFYNELKLHVRSLEALGIEAGQYEVILVPLILQCLPAGLRMEWAREGDQREAEVEFLITFLQKEIERCEQSEIYAADFVSPSFPSSPSSTHSSSSSTPMAGVALHTFSRCPRPPHSPKPNKGTQPPFVKCICKKSSFSKLKRCPEWGKLTVDERKAKLATLRACKRCLRIRQNQNCNCKYHCFTCEGPHHSALCSEVIRKKTGSISNSDCIQTNPVLTTTTPDMCECSSNILLQTVKVPVKGKHKTVDAIVLFDLGSNRTYVTQDFVDKVAPEFVEKKTLVYSSFGSSSVSPCENASVYNLCLQGKTNTYVNATCINIICTPLS